MPRLALFAAVSALLLAACGDGGGSINVTAPQTEQQRVINGMDSVAAQVAKGAGIGENMSAPSSDNIIVLSGDGLGKVTFSMARDAAVQQVESMIGQSIGRGTNAECGAGPLDNVDFQGGLVMFFQDGKFVGWSVDGRGGSPYRTGKNVAIGTTMQKLRETGDVAVSDTSLGVEFTVDEISGLVTANKPEGYVTNLWAGTTCAFR